MINELAKEIHLNAKSKGFFDEPKNTGEMLCLIHSEVSEALEADRKSHDANFKAFDTDMENWKGDELQYNIRFKSAFEAHIKNSFGDELADVIIRVLDLAEHKGINMENHIHLKMRYNAMREHKHGKKY